MRNYEDLQVWRKAHDLTLAIYKSRRCFPREERFGLTSQIRRSCASIGANLAEGCGRRSDRGDGSICIDRDGIGRGTVISSAARSRFGLCFESIF